MCISESGIRYIREIRKKVYELIGENYAIADIVTEAYEKARNDFLSNCLNRRVKDDKRNN